MDILSLPLPAGQPLAEAYTNHKDSAIIKLFGSHPREDEDWINRAKWLEANVDNRVSAEALAVVLRDFNKRYNDHPQVERGISLIAGGAAVIVGGQQAGLWTGPMLVIYKAITILQSARHASKIVGQPVVPVFWIAGEDHDWDEANHAYVDSREDGIRKIALDRPAGPRTAVSRTGLAKADLLQVVDQLAAILEDTAFKQELLARLTTYAEQSDTLSNGFAYFMGELFGEQGLVLIDADDPAVRQLEAPMFQQMIERNDELEAAYLSGAAAIVERGYHAQADVVPGGANLFLFHADQEGQAGERTLLYKQEGKFVNRKGTFSYTREELLESLANNPSSFSNNVLTRPLMQDYLLPVLGAVLGQGEIAYWALTAEAFRCMGMRMPIIVPRMSFTWIEGTIAKHMDGFDLTFEDVIMRFEERRRSWLQERDEWSIGERFAAMRAEFNALYSPLLQVAGEIESGLTPLAETNKRKIMEQMAFMETRMQEAHTRRFDTVLKRLDRVASSLWPEGKPQERVLNVTVLLNRYGKEWLTAMLELPYDPLGGHRVIYL